MILGIALLKEGVIIPKYAHPGDSGMDVFPLETKTLSPGSTKLIKLGFALKIPEGHEIQIRSRSGLALKHQVVVTNSPATIDRGYTGEIGVILTNHSFEPYYLTPDRAIAQMVLAPVTKAKLVEMSEEELAVYQTPRGSGAYGSTDNTASEIITEVLAS